MLGLMFCSYCLDFNTFFFFEQTVSDFNFALGPTDCEAGPGWQCLSSVPRAWSPLPSCEVGMFPLALHMTFQILFCHLGAKASCRHGLLL